MPMNTGSDTRMYNPRSESSLGYTKDDDDYPYGYGNPEAMEVYRDQKQAEKDKPTLTDELPHLQISIPEPSPQMPPMMPEEEEEPPMMDDQFNQGQQFGAMTGMPDMGNLSLGAATGTMPAPGGMLATGQPMDLSWRLLKGGMKNILTSVMEIGAFATIQNLVNDGMSLDNAERLVSQAVDIINNNPQDYSYNPNVRNFKESAGLPPMKEGESPENYFKKITYPDPTLPDSPPSDPSQFIGPSIHGRVDKETGELIPTPFDEAWQQKNASEPMEDAWSSLMKSKLDQMGSSKDKTWQQPQYETAAGGSQQETATPRRAKLQSRHISPAKKRGLDQAPLSVHRTHLGISTKQPLRMFPQKYQHQMSTQARRKLMGNIPQSPAGHGLGAEVSYNPRSPQVSSSQGLPLTEPQTIREMGQAFGKSNDIHLLKKDIEELRKKADYMQFTQMRRLLEQLKDLTERRQRQMKAANQGGHGNNREAGHREGQDSTTRPEGGTEDLENDPKNWGAPSLLFAAKGSGRVG